MDALLATVQMPGGVPVAAMAIGKAGAKNAALFAIQILGRNDSDLARKFKQYRQTMGDKVRETEI
jgi:phosphoribosylaminoimidazole carboxylase PurE protein